MREDEKATLLGTSLCSAAVGISPTLESSVCDFDTDELFR